MTIRRFSVSSCRPAVGRGMLTLVIFSLGALPTVAAAKLYALAGENNAEMIAIEPSVMAHNELTFPLPSGEQRTFTRVARPADKIGSTPWFGTPDGEAALTNWVLVTERNGIVLVTLQDSEQRWEGRPTSDGRLVLKKTLGRARPSTHLCGIDAASSAISAIPPSDFERPLSPQQSFEIADSWRLRTASAATNEPGLTLGETLIPSEAAAASEVTTYDVLIIYTPATRVALGGSFYVEAVAQHFVDYANIAYANSGLDLGVRIVDLREIGYAESGYLVSDLAALKANKTVRKWIGATHADVVTMIVNFGVDFGGYAGLPNQQIPTALRAEAFSVMQWNQEPLILAHEIGHNFGAQHDVYHAASPSQAMFPFGYGHYVDGVFRTVMSYTDQCAYGCPAAPLFSTPYRTVSGYPAGIEFVLENARVLYLNSFLMANLRGPAKKPPTPKSLKKIAATTDSVTLSWKHGNSNLDGTAVFLSDGFRWHFLGLVDPAYRSIPISGLSPATTYRFQVYAWRRSGGLSSASPTLRVTTPYY